MGIILHVVNLISYSLKPTDFVQLSLLATWPCGSFRIELFGGVEVSFAHVGNLVNLSKFASSDLSTVIEDWQSSGGPRLTTERCGGRIAVQAERTDRGKCCVASFDKCLERLPILTSSFAVVRELNLECEPFFARDIYYDLLPLLLVPWLEAQKPFVVLEDHILQLTIMADDGSKSGLVVQLDKEFFGDADVELATADAYGPSVSQ